MWDWSYMFDDGDFTRTSNRYEDINGEKHTRAMDAFDDRRPALFAAPADPKPHGLPQLPPDTRFSTGEECVWPCGRSIPTGNGPV